MITNKLNIGDKVKVNFDNPNIVGEGEIGPVTSIQLIGSEIYYTLSLDSGFDSKSSEEGCLPIHQYIQVKEGQYEPA